MSECAGTRVLVQTWLAWKWGGSPFTVPLLPSFPVRQACLDLHLASVLWVPDARSSSRGAAAGAAQRQLSVVCYPGWSWSNCPASHSPRPESRAQRRGQASQTLPSWVRGPVRELSPSPPPPQSPQVRVWDTLLLH